MRDRPQARSHNLIDETVMKNSRKGATKDPLQEAIKLHEAHMENPATATMKSQRELMDLMMEHQAMMKTPKRKSYGMKDGGRVRPNMLGIGMARAAGEALAGRPKRIEAALSTAEAAPVAPTGIGGLSARRDDATPPADMLARQRRGMKDGGKVPPPGTGFVINNETGKRSNFGNGTTRGTGFATNNETGKRTDFGDKVKYKQDGGKINGPGGPTDDKAGTYDLSNGEYVLPADTTAAIGIGKLDAIRNATHRFVDDNNRGMRNGGTDEEKRRMVKAGGSEMVQGIRPETRNNVELAKLQKPVMQSIGEGIGEIGSAAAKGIGTAARKLEDTRKGALTIANNLPGAIAAPIATAASNFGAAVRTGYTGQPQTGTEYVGKPLFGDTVSSAVAAPTDQPVRPSISAPTQGRVITPSVTPAGTNPAINVIPARTNPSTRQAIPQNTTQPQAASDRFGIGAFMSGSNRADGKQNVFSGEGSTGKYSVNPADFNAATARAASDKSKLASLAVSGVNEGTTEGIERAYRLAAGDPEATAAVEAAIKQRRLSVAALGGNKNAAGILNQQSDDATKIGIANIGAKLDQAKLGIAQGALDIQRKQFESSDAVNRIDAKTKQAKLKDIEQATALRDQILAMPDNDPRRAGLVKKYNLLPGAESKDKFTPLMGKDDIGNPVYIGAFDNRTGEMRSASGQGGVSREAAADAVRRGADKAAVNKRLVAAGLQPI